MHHGYDRRRIRRPAPTDADDATSLALPAMSYLLDSAHATPEDLAMLREEFGPDSTPLGWDAVYAVESEHGIVLPEPYRSFVATIGDGSYSGPPDYGLMELGVLPPDWGAGRPERNLGKPFPLTGQWIWEGGNAPEPDEDELAPVYDHGSLILGTDGCGMYWHLIVTGEHRGHIYLIDEMAATPFGAEFGLTSGKPGFAGWVKHWAEGKEWWDRQEATALSSSPDTEER